MSRGGYLVSCPGVTPSHIWGGPCPRPGDIPRPGSGGYPIPGPGGVPHPRSWGGTPSQVQGGTHPRSGEERVPPPDPGYPPSQTWDGAPPSQTWDGVPPLDLTGVPPPQSCELTNKLKTVPSPILRMRAVKIIQIAIAQTMDPPPFRINCFKLHINRTNIYSNLCFKISNTLHLKIQQTAN